MASNVRSANLTANAVAAQGRANRRDSVSVKQTSWTSTRSHTRFCTSSGNNLFHLAVSTWQQHDTQPQAPVGTAGPSSIVETNVECKLFSTPHLGDAARGPQQPTLSPQVATKDTAQQSMCDHSKASAHMRSVEIDLPPNTDAQALLHIAYMGLILLKQTLQHVVSTLNMVMYTLLPTLATSAWLCLSMLAAAMNIYAETSRPSKCVPSPQVMQTCVSLVSLLNIAANVTMFILTQVHCMLTVAAACSFLAQPHWITACLTCFTFQRQ